MSGIYLHIPYCKQACTYCNFHFVTSLYYKDAVVRAMVKELQDEKHYLQGEPVKTIYFGGGTPSLLETNELEALLQAVYNNYRVDPNAEITLEANPDDITPERIGFWKQLGINRLSIGVQSFSDDELRWMNRAHTADQSIQCIHICKKNGIDNLNIDLIYGSPLLTDEQWKENVQLAVNMGVQHLSCYALTVEEKTPLDKQIRRQKKENVDSDKQARQFLLLMDWMRAYGYEHYEVSNFARPGFRSRHNSGYWRGETYLGIGPSAHSYNSSERRWNVSNNTLYLKQFSVRESEELSDEMKLNEYVMVSLRTKEGIKMQKIETCWGLAEKERIMKHARQFHEKGLLIFDNGFICLTDQGMLLADGIASELFK